MFRNLFIKIFALIFLFVSIPNSVSLAANSHSNKSYTLPVKLVEIHSAYPSR